MIDYSRLRGVIPDSVFDELQDVSEKYQINTRLRIAHFLGQCAHESGNFKRVEENLNYTAERLKVVFPKYFNVKNAAEYARDPVRIANRVYGNRMGNGNEESGEGYKYRGRGYIQLTGKDNYKAFDLNVTESILDDPDLVASKYPLLYAAWFWNEKNLNECADLNDTVSITRRINGGLNGLDDRQSHVDTIYNYLRGK